jgi:hypothetical protein
LPEAQYGVQLWTGKHGAAAHLHRRAMLTQPSQRYVAAAVLRSGLLVSPPLAQFLPTKKIVPEASHEIIELDGL